MVFSLLANRSGCASRTSTHHRRSAATFQPRLEPLEDRCLLSTLFVTNTLDNASTPGSLRAAIQAAKNGDTIRFDPSLSQATILLENTLAITTTSLTIDGLGADQLTVERDPTSKQAFGLFSIGAGTTVALSGLHLANGDSPAGQGGAISNAGNLTVNACWLDGNTVVSHGSGSAEGGAVSNRGTFTAIDSTFTDNSALGASTQAHAGKNGDGLGGALYNKGGTVTLTNVTFFGNTAAGATGKRSLGGAIDNDAGTVRIDNSTIAGNTSAGGGTGGGVYNSTKGVIEVENTIIATNTAAVGADVAGAFISDGYNLIGAATGSTGFTSTGDQVGSSGSLLDPQFASTSPEDNGGPTPTLALADSSPALGKGNPANAPASDQRGFLRTVDGKIDIGSVENQSNPVTVTTLVLTPSLESPTAGQFLAITVTVSPLLPALTSSVPAGSVDFSIDGGSSMSGVALGSLAPDQWVLTLPSGLAAGPHLIEADFTPTGTNDSASSADLHLTVAPTPTSAPQGQVLYNFGNAPDAWQPWGSLTLVGSTLYGYTAYGGDKQSGAIFEINTDGLGYQIVHSFGGLVVNPGGEVLRDGITPHHDSLRIVGDELVGATVYGGDAGQGVLYAYNYVTGSYRIIHELNGFSKSNPGGSPADGAQPHSNPMPGVTPGGQDVLYGMTSEGGSSQDGTLYQVNVNGTGFQVLNSFQKASGDDPHGFVIQIGNTLYGMTRSGGTTPQGTAGQGVIFSYDLTATQNPYTPLHTFGSITNDGLEPDHGGLILVGSSLYGLATAGGTKGDGILFSVALPSGTYTPLYSFTGSTTGTLDGSGPHGSLELGSDGVTLFGMTSKGGSANDGVVFSFDTSAPNTAPYVIRSFLGGSRDGNDGLDNVVVGDNVLYGLTKYGGDVKTNDSPKPPAPDFTSTGPSHANGVVFALPLTDQTMTTLMSSTNPSVVGQSVTFTVTVQGETPGSNTPEGSVTFKDGGKPLTVVSLVNGQASYTTSTLSLGQHTITASYGGFSVGPFSYAMSESQPLVQQVNQGSSGGPHKH
jgi:uncharacterized repeat protein (TIGR03803 family)